MTTRTPFSDLIRRFGFHDDAKPRSQRWSMLPNRSHLRRGDRRMGHILRIRHHRGQHTI